MFRQLGAWVSGTDSTIWKQRKRTTSVPDVLYAPVKAFAERETEVARKVFSILFQFGDQSASCTQASGARNCRGLPQRICQDRYGGKRSFSTGLPMARDGLNLSIASPVAEFGHRKTWMSTAIDALRAGSLAWRTGSLFLSPVAVPVGGCQASPFLHLPEGAGFANGQAEFGRARHAATSARIRIGWLYTSATTFGSRALFGDIAGKAGRGGAQSAACRLA